jgi:hypothetical protein
MSINNFVVIDSIYGKFIVNRYCDYQAEALIKTGATHIEPELKKYSCSSFNSAPGCISP